MLDFIDEQDEAYRSFYPASLTEHYAGNFYLDTLNHDDVKFATDNCGTLASYAAKSENDRVNSDPDLLRDCELRASFSALDAAAAAHVATKAAKDAARVAMRAIIEEKEVRAAAEEGARLNEEEVRNNDSSAYPQSPQQQSEQLAEPHATPENKQHKTERDETEQTTTRTRRSKRRKTETQLNDESVTV